MKEFIISIALKVIIPVIKYLPKKLFPLFALKLYYLYYPFLKKNRRLIEKNIELCYELKAGTHFSKRFVKQVLVHQIICGLETIRLTLKPEDMVLSGYEELQNHISSANLAAKGHLIVTAHIGAWENVARYPAQANAGNSFKVLAKPSSSNALNKLLIKLRKQMNVEVLWTDNINILKEMITTLRANGAIGFVMDQKPEKRRGIEVDFFKQKTSFVSGPALMAAKLNCAVISVFCIRVGEFKYRLISDTLLSSNHYNDETDIEQYKKEITQLMANNIEDIIKVYPEQWLWNYRRWKST